MTSLARGEKVAPGVIGSMVAHSGVELFYHEEVKPIADQERDLDRQLRDGEISKAAALSYIFS